MIMYYIVIFGEIATDSYISKLPIKFTGINYT